MQATAVGAPTCCTTAASPPSDRRRAAGWRSGRSFPLAKLGYARDGVKGRPQFVFSLLTTAEGCPVAVKVFEGNTGDAATVATQIDKLKNRFGLERVCSSATAGWITDARLREDIRPAQGVDWITALRPEVHENSDRVLSSPKGTKTLIRHAAFGEPDKCTLCTRELRRPKA